MVLTKTIEQNTAKQLFLNTYRETELSLEALIDYIQLLYDSGGPTEEEYEPLNDALMYYRRHIPAEDWKAASEQVVTIFGPAFIDSIAGHAYLKPYGYPGDFEVIDKMYLQVISKHAALKKWDLFYHQHAAATAVRNRKAFFKNLLLEKTKNKQETCRVLDVASGPCRDLLEFFQETKTTNLAVECVEADAKAIEHATELNAAYLSNITFFNKNIFRFRTEKKYDLVWSAGLFDYFDDRTFTRFLQKVILQKAIWNCLRVGIYIIEALNY